MYDQLKNKITILFNNKIVGLLVVVFVFYFLFIFGWDQDMGPVNWPQDVPVSATCTDYHIPKNKQELHTFLSSSRDSGAHRAVINCVLSQSKYHYSTTVNYNIENKVVKNEIVVADVYRRKHISLMYNTHTTAIISYDKQDVLYAFNLNEGIE